MKKITGRAIDCVYMLTKVLDLSGDIIELGVGDGDTSLELAQYIKKNNLDKKIFSCDVFTGLPYTDKNTPVISDLKKGECFGGTIEVFKEKIKKLKLDKIVIPVIGLFEDTLLKELNSKNFCFAFVDVDLYKSALIAYNFLEDRIGKEGILGFHDYDFYRTPGPKFVVDNVLSKEKFRKIDYKCKDKYCIFFERI